MTRKQFIFLSIIIVLINIVKSQYPYVINQILSVNSSEVIGLYSSDNLIRAITQKGQIFTYEYIKGKWSLSGTKLLNSNAQNVSFSGNGDMIAYKAHRQVETTQTVFKTYWVICGCYWISTTDKNWKIVQHSKDQRRIAYAGYNGAISIYSQNGASQKLLQYIYYPRLDDYKQMNQNSLTISYSQTLSNQVLMNIPVFDHIISHIVFSYDSTILAIVYNRNFLVKILRNKGTSYQFFQALDQATSLIYRPSISNNFSFIILPTETSLLFYQLYNLQSNGGQYILQQTIPLDTVPKHFMTTPDYKTLVVANQTDIVIFQYNDNKHSYDKKWRGRFNNTIQKISMKNSQRIFVSLNNKQGIVQLVTCGFSSKPCNQSSLIVKSAGNPTFFNFVQQIQKVNNQQPVNFLVPGLVISIFLIMISFLIISICIYHKVGKINNKVGIDSTKQPSFVQTSQNQLKQQNKNIKQFQQQQIETNIQQKQLQDRIQLQIS